MEASQLPQGLHHTSSLHGTWSLSLGRRIYVPCGRLLVPLVRSSTVFSLQGFHSCWSQLAGTRCQMGHQHNHWRFLSTSKTWLQRSSKPSAHTSFHDLDVKIGTPVVDVVESTDVKSTDVESMDVVKSTDAWDSNSHIRWHHLNCYPSDHQLTVFNPEVALQLRHFYDWLTDQWSLRIEGILKFVLTER